MEKSHPSLLKRWVHEKEYNHVVKVQYTVKILKFGTPQTIAIIVLKIEKFYVTLH